MALDEQLEDQPDLLHLDWIDGEQAPLQSSQPSVRTWRASRVKETDSLMARRRNSWLHGPRPSVPDPRRHLLEAVLAFVRAARSTPGVLRIALIGSLTTDKPIPKDADVLVTIDAATDLDPLARRGRRLQGTAQTINLGADIFLADAAGRYMGRICHYRECRPRVACRALSCGLRQHLNDDLQLVTLSPTLVATPPIELWPHVVAPGTVAADTQALLLAPLDEAVRTT